MKGSSETMHYYGKVDIPRDFRGELALPKVPKHKPMSMKCETCAWTSFGARKPNNVKKTMRRLYNRTKNEWISVGWFCEECGSVVIDELKRVERLFPVPEPKVTVLRKID